jgi:hypothetical protein
MGRLTDPSARSAGLGGRAILLLPAAAASISRMTFSRLLRSVGPLVVVLVMMAGACSSGGSEPCTGALGCACYPNSTCNQGLTCEANMCVASGGQAGAGGTGGVSAGHGGAPAGSGGVTTGVAGATTGVGGTTTGAGGSAGASAGKGGTTGGAGTTGAAGSAINCTPGSEPSTLIANSLGLAGYGTSTYYDRSMFKWFGYLSTFSYGGATIRPTGNGAFNSQPNSVCACGTVPASDNAGAGLAWNIFQIDAAYDPNTVVQSRTVQGNSSIYVNFASGYMPTMRMSLITSDGTNYCTSVPPNGGGISAGVFNTACWDGSGTSFTSSDVKTFQVVVPGSASGAQTFSFCIADMGPVMFNY